MTIVLAYNDGPHPFVIGDLLVSGPEQPGRRAHVPTIGFADRVFPEGSGYTIVGLAQKVTIVADNCVVAWAGSRLAATSFVRILRAEAETAQLTCDRVGALFSEVAQNFRKVDLSIVGAIVHDEGVGTFKIDAQTLDCSPFGPMHVAGTGVPAFAPTNGIA